MINFQSEGEEVQNETHFLLDERTEQVTLRNSGKCLISSTVHYISLPWVMFFSGRKQRDANKHKSR